MDQEMQVLKLNQAWDLLLKRGVAPILVFMAFHN